MKVLLLIDIGTKTTLVIHVTHPIPIQIKTKILFTKSKSSELVEVDFSVTVAISLADHSSENFC